MIVKLSTDNSDVLIEMAFRLLLNRIEWVYHSEDCSESSTYPVETLVSNARHAMFGAATFYVKFPKGTEGEELAAWFKLRF